VTFPLIVAHRTCPPFAPENSLEGVRVAAEQGADAIEVDLRMTLDQRAFLMHDNTMRRTTGWPLPIELTPSFLVRRQRLKDSSAGEHPPDLSQVCDALPEGKMLAFDVKTHTSILPLASAISRRGLQQRVLIWCASALVVRFALRRLPGVEVAYYKDYDDPESNVSFIGRAQRLGAQAVSLDWRSINEAVVSTAHHSGLKVYSWHKEYELTADKLHLGLDGIITDYPAKVRATIGAL
jgi:glycerophosphoryl diester phosphodiesterase